MRRETPSRNAYRNNVGAGSPGRTYDLYQWETDERTTIVASMFRCQWIRTRRPSGHGVDSGAGLSSTTSIALPRWDDAGVRS